MSYDDEQAQSDALDDLMDRPSSLTPHSGYCDQRCGQPAEVYAIDPRPDGWGGRYCRSCATALRFTVVDELDQGQGA
jgi:hypothetical protein